MEWLVVYLSEEFLTEIHFISHQYTCILKKETFCFVVAVCDLVHDVQFIQGIC